MKIRAPRTHDDTPWPAWPRLAAAIVAGLLTGGFAAWAYYGGTFYPLSHTFGLWIVIVALLSARQPRPQAILVSLAALLAAVMAFFYGKKVMYGIKFPGMPYSVSAGELVEWGVLAVVAAVLLGSVFARIGVRGRAGSIGCACAIGLLAADAYRRAGNYPPEAPVLIGFAALAIAAVLVVAVRTRRQLVSIAVWTIPAVLIGYGLVSAPDVLEQLLIIGSL